MDVQLYQIIYISTANPELTEDALMKILSGSQHRNQAREITGLLLHADGNIIQVLEGPENEVKSLYETISNDKRHRGVALMSSRSIDKRDFPEYKMGFKRAHGNDFTKNVPGFTDIVERRNVTEKDIEGTSRLVSTFIRTFAKTARIGRFNRE